MIRLSFLFVALGAATAVFAVMALGGMNELAMASCQIEHSFETCFHSLN
jgi:hypothetical protein